MINTTTITITHPHSINEIDFIIDSILKDPKLLSMR